MTVRLATLLLMVPLMCNIPLARGEVTAERSERGVTVKIDGQLFTEYLVRSGSKPILWPILGPTGKPMTRAYPMQKDINETKDHIHQRSLWFTHGNVNGVDFWSEVPRGRTGTIVHREFVKIAGGQHAVIVTRNDWLDPRGDKVCEDLRTITFAAADHSRWIDFEITIRATSGPVTFGDTKEGSFGMRLAESLTVKHGGHIVNSRDEVDAAAWGRRASWVDYHGPVDGQTLGIAILNHPSSFRYPTAWHVRDYGLFAANPFGQQGFDGRADSQGAYTIPAGGQVKLKYRVLLHLGDQQQGKVAEAFSAYATAGR